MINVIFQFLGLELFNIKLSAKFFQNIPNGLRVKFHCFQNLNLGKTSTNPKCHLTISWATSCQYQCVCKSTYCNFLLRCAYGKSNFQRWTNACTNMIKWSLDISSLYLSTLFFHLYVFSGGKIVVEYMYCLARLTLSLWKNVTPVCNSWFNFVHCSTCTRFKLYNNLLIR